MLATILAAAALRTLRWIKGAMMPKVPLERILSPAAGQLIGPSRSVRVRVGTTFAGACLSRCR